ncbi:MAG: FlgD immunoglobulin-like domain containing protein [Hyphomicrobiales bacterium]
MNVPRLSVRPALAGLLVFGLLGGPAATGVGTASRALAAGLPARSTGDVRPLGAQDRAGRAPALSTADTITVFHADLETLSSPGNEGGWTHADQSGIPTAWHIAPTVACQGNAFWCGLTDSSWTGDPDRNGYANNWRQTLMNYVDLTNANSPVKLSFKQTMNLEPDFDYGTVEALDLVEGWIPLATFTGAIPSGSAACDTFTVQIPDSIIAKSSTVYFRFVMTSDTQGSSADGLYPAAKGWAVDNVTVKAGLNDIRFFDDFESGPGTWTVSTFPAVGDFWHIASGSSISQQCITNTSKVWTPIGFISGSLVPRMNDVLVTPTVAVSNADQVFFSFDVFRVLPLGACYYYGFQFRTRKVGLPWSSWIDPTGLLYFGTEAEWLRQTVPLTGAGGADSLQVRLSVKDYADVFCDGVSASSGTAVYFDNLDVRVLGLAGPSLATSETSLFNDTFQTTAFFGNDNFNTPRGDSTVVSIGASRGLKSASLWTSLNGAAFVSSPLTAVGAGAPTLYYGDVAAGAYPRGTDLRYYFSATDSTDAVSTLPVDALTNGSYFRATILPAVFTPTTPCPTDSARVLYVNAYASPTATTAVDQSFAALGVRYDRYDVNGAAAGLGNSPGGGDPNALGAIWPATSATALSGYSVIVWDVGDRSAFTLSAQDQTLLQSWLALGGRNRGLLLAGDNLAYDLVVNGAGLANFLNCTIGTTYLRDIWETSPQDSLTPTLTGAAGTRIASEPFGLDGDCPGLNRFDGLAVAPCVGAQGRSWLLYPNGVLAATERTAPLGTGTDSARVIPLGFSLATMTNTVRRNLFLWRTVVEEMKTPYCTTPTGIEVSPAAVPAVPRLDPAMPNPFNPETVIGFSLPRAARATLRVYDVHGRLVRTLADGVFGPGDHRVRWDGTDGAGRAVGSGAYFARLTADGRSEARKVVLLR